MIWLRICVFRKQRESEADFIKNRQLGRLKRKAGEKTQISEREIQVQEERNGKKFIWSWQLFLFCCAE